MPDARPSPPAPLPVGEGPGVLHRWTGFWAGAGVGIADSRIEYRVAMTD